MFYQFNSQQSTISSSKSLDNIKFQLDMSKLKSDKLGPEELQQLQERIECKYLVVGYVVLTIHSLQKLLEWRNKSFSTVVRFPKIGTIAQWSGWPIFSFCWKYFSCYPLIFFWIIMANRFVGSSDSKDKILFNSNWMYSVLLTTD